MSRNLLAGGGFCFRVDERILPAKCNTTGVPAPDLTGTLELS